MFRWELIWFLINSHQPVSVNQLGYTKPDIYLTVLVCLHIYCINFYREQKKAALINCTLPVQEQTANRYSWMNIVQHLAAEEPNVFLQTYWTLKQRQRGQSLWLD